MSNALDLEQNYVHDVYKQLAPKLDISSCTVRQHVNHFISHELENCHLLLDIGCGNSKHLCPNAFTVGIDRCIEWFEKDPPPKIMDPPSRILENGSRETIVADMMNMPFRSEIFDGALFCEVLHHISTVERRVQALSQITECLTNGSRILITVKAFEKWKIGSQDVLMNSEQQNVCQKSIDDDRESVLTLEATADSIQQPRPVQLGRNLIQRALQKFNLGESLFYANLSRSRSNKQQQQQKELFKQVFVDETLIEIRNIDEHNLPIGSANDTIIEQDEEEQTTLITSTPSTTSDYSEPSKQDYNSLISMIKVKLAASSNIGIGADRSSADRSNVDRSNVDRRNVDPSSAAPVSVIEKGTKAKKPLSHRFSLPAMPSFDFTNINVREKFKKSLSMLERENNNVVNESNLLCTEKVTPTTRRLVDLNDVVSLEGSLQSTNKYETVSTVSIQLERKASPLTVCTEEDVLFERPTVGCSPISEGPTHQNFLPIRPTTGAVRPTTLDTTLDTTSSLRTKYLRSSSVDCKDSQRRVSPLDIDQPRRFSASPHLAYNLSDESHSSSPSDVRTSDTSASPITIVPVHCTSTNQHKANTSCLSDDSLPDNAIIDDSSFASSGDVFGDSLSEDHDVFGDSLSEDQDCSFRSSSSPPESLATSIAEDDEAAIAESQQLLEQHCYYHLFRRGELEALISNNVKSLHVIRSYFSDEDATWCVIAQKKTVVK